MVPTLPQLLPQKYFNASKIFKLSKLKTVRRMFPTVRVSFRNVPEGGRYLVLLDIVPCDNKRYR